MIATITFMVIGALALASGLTLVKLTTLVALGGILSYAGFVLMVAMMVLLPYGRIRAKHDTYRVNMWHDYLVKQTRPSEKEIRAYNDTVTKLRAKMCTPCWTFYNKYWLRKMKPIVR